MSNSPLLTKIRRLIELNGPMNVGEYMAHSLGDPVHGYYMTRDPFGAGGDFTTAPEVSQMFGEIIGAWLVHVWRMSGAPSPARLVELGPGRGTLMADILRVASRTADFLAVISLHLVETSPVLRARQEETLRRSGVPAAWCDSLRQVPEGPLFLVANEFFDALPIRQFARVSGEWRERVVGIGPDGVLAFGIGPGGLKDGPPAPDGAVLETSPARTGAMSEIAARLVHHGGTALVIDYGYAQPGLGDTLQAVRAHGYVDPLADPGEADLTSHVDFAALAQAATLEGATVHGPLPQGEFLLGLGLAERAEQFARRLDEAGRTAIRAASDRLVSPTEMGTLFEVLAVTAPGLSPPPFVATG